MTDVAYPVRSCPDHPSSALELDEGVFCFACGREVVEDAFAGGVTRDASAALVEAARLAWQASRTVAAFGAEAQLAARGMLDDTPPDE